MDELKEAAQLENEEIRKFMAVMNQALDQLGAGDARHTTLATGIYRLQQESGVLPPTTALKSNVHVRRIGRYPVGGGPKCDIWEGQWLENEKVALKALRNSRFPPKERKRFQREVNIWRLVWEADKGKYILPFYGTVTDDGPYPLLVSPWQANGTAIEWVKKHPDDIDYIKLVLGVACGIRVLHDWDTPIVHGDLKGENILISDAGEPLLSDFGLSKILEDCTGTPFTQTKGISDSFRWFAPEIFHSGKLTTSSDVFSFSMTALELFTGMPPFSHIKQPPQVLIRMERGERPEKPTDSLVKARGLDDTLWEFLEKCWAQDPNARPSIQEVIQELTPPRYPLDTF
ncbi:kinase-like protein [Sistotremastrum niveocremeum HHB9708]|uniref:Kinase-like protein n=1 Tax=Sistotremastrum niveocremeum HHB9708 TaxID=1314777 RepID=A0A164ZDY9_9AGAM|nr:kinase-like protein [Sistotremastrum niveocremeum HHB9708]